MKWFYVLHLAWEWMRVHRDLPRDLLNRERLSWDEFKRIIAAYSEDHRFYHILRHISKTVRIARECYKDARSEKISLVVMALIWHDIIYVIGSKTNEEDSAAAWEAYAKGRFAPDIIIWVSRLILLTKSHKLSEDADGLSRIMNDCDMSILAADEDEYLEYARNIWREYRSVGKEAYLAGRLAFLKNLDANTLFHTPVPSTYLAELNIAIEIELLEDYPEQILVD